MHSNVITGDNSDIKRGESWQEALAQILEVSVVVSIIQRKPNVKYKTELFMMSAPRRWLDTTFSCVFID